MSKIEIDLADLGFRYDDEDSGYKATIQDLIVEQAARLILREDGVRERVRQRVESIVDAEATEQVRAAVRDILTGPIQRTTSWGEAKGEPTTVREIVREKVEAFLSAPGNRRDGFGSSSGAKNLADLIDEATRNVLSGDLAGTVKEAKAKVHERVTRAALDAAVKELAR